MKSEPIEKTLNITPYKLNAYSSALLQGTAYSRLHTYLSRTLVPFNLSIPEWKLLGQLYEHGRVKLSELAELLSYDPPMVTKLAKMLEKKELVKRLPDELDERAKVISNTVQGKKLIEQIEPEVKKTMAILLKGTSTEELHVYIKVLTLIVNNTY